MTGLGDQGEGGTSRLLAVTGVLLLVHALASALAWPTLPDEIPLRLGEGGEPAEWGPPSPWSWFGLPVVSGLVVLALVAASRRLARRPLFLDPSGRRRFRALAPDGQARVLTAIRSTIEAAALPMAVVFLLVHAGAYSAVMGRGGTGWMLAGLLVSLLTFPILVLALPRRAEGALEREWRRPG